MDYVNLSSLPRKTHRGVECIDWKNTPNNMLDFSYKNFNGFFYIESYNDITQIISLKYKDKIFQVPYYYLSNLKLRIFRMHLFHTSNDQVCEK